MPNKNKLSGKRSVKPATNVTLENQTPEQAIPQQPAPKKRGRPRKNLTVEPVPSAPVDQQAPADFPAPQAKKTRKPRAKKTNTELMDQVPTAKQKGKQKVEVEVEVQPVIKVRKPRMTKAQKLKQIEQEEQSEEENEEENEDEDEEEEDSDQELDRAIARLERIKRLQSD